MIENNKIINLLSFYKNIGIDYLVEDISKAISLGDSQLNEAETSKNVILDSQSHVGALQSGVLESYVEIAKENAFIQSKVLQIKEDLATLDSMADLNEYISRFEHCGIKKTAMNTIKGIGNLESEVFILAGAPSNEEDESGLAFSGKEGIFLKKIIKSMAVSNNAFMSYSVFWRPPGNRNPNHEELAVCLPIIEKMISILKPKYLILVDEIARKLFFTNSTLSAMIGKWHNVKISDDKLDYSVLVRVIFSAKYLINNPLKKKNMWLDLMEISDKVNNLEDVKNLEDLSKKLSKIEGLGLKQNANNTVLGYGNKNADILLIGEAPGQEEDKLGVPFVGRSGKLLDQIFSKVGLSRENIFITNTVFWRPEENRNPTLHEITLCYPFVKKIIEIVNPKIIVFVGRIATTKFYKGNPSMSSVFCHKMFWLYCSQTLC